jgi:hypothetical protein
VQTKAVLAADLACVIGDLMLWLERAARILTQQRNTKNKRYALHAPEVECISTARRASPASAPSRSAWQSPTSRA